MRGDEGTFWAAGEVLFLYLREGDARIYMCKQSLICTLKVCCITLQVCYVSTIKVHRK